MQAPKRRTGHFAILVFALTAAFHGALVLFFLPPAQLAKYPVAASRYLKDELSAERMLDFSPLYFYLHVMAQKVASRPDALVLLLHVACSALSAAILFLLLARFFRGWIATAGVLAFILDRGLVAYLQAFEPEPCLLLLLLLFAWSATAGSVRGHLAAGIFLGLAVWTRPTFLPLLLVVPAYLYLDAGGKRVRSSVLAFATPVILLLVALWLRNASALGYFSPFVMNPGTVFYEGNNPNSWGSSSIYPPLVDEVARMHPQESDYQHAAYRLIARKVTGKELSLPEINRYWSEMSLHFLQDHPYHALRLYGTKLFHAFHAYRWHDVASAFWNDRWLAAHYIPASPFALVSALALVGLVVGAARWRGFLLFYAVFLIQLLVTTVTYVSARQRVSTLWIFILFACAAVELAMVGRRRMLATCLVVLPLAALLSSKTDLMTEETRLWLGIHRSNELLGESYRLRSEERLEEAALASAAALAAAPFYLDSRRPANLSFEPRGYAASAAALLDSSEAPASFDRAVLLVEGGDAEGARAALQDVLSSGVRLKRDFYQSSEPYYYLARAALQRQDRQRAALLLEEAERRSPGDPSTLALLHVLSRDGKDLQKLVHYFGELDARHYVGRAAVAADAPDLAVPNLEYVCRMLPDYRRGRVYLAAALGMAGRLDEGAAQYRAAMRLGGDPVLLERESIALFASVSAERPQDAFALYAYGVILRRFGHYHEALEVQKRARSLQATSAIESEIAGLEKARSAP